MNHQKTIHNLIELISKTEMKKFKSPKQVLWKETKYRKISEPLKNKEEIFNAGILIFSEESEREDYKFNATERHYDFIDYYLVKDLFDSINILIEEGHGYQSYYQRHQDRNYEESKISLVTIQDFIDKIDKVNFNWFIKFNATQYRNSDLIELKSVLLFLESILIESELKEIYLHGMQNSILKE